MIKWNNSETHTWNLQTTSTFNSVDPFQFTFPQNYLLAGKLLCHRVIYCYFSYGHQCRPEAGDRTCFSFLFFLLKVSLYLISFCDLQLSSWKADPGFACYEYNGQFCFFFFRLPKVISCSGLLSYFQINYFQDSYSHICSEKLHSWLWVCSVSGLSRVHFHSYSFTLEKWNKGDSVWAPL